MEDIKAYIESGILELYVMGELSPDEMREVEMMAAQHPAVQTELTEIEKSLESYAKINAMSPSEELRDKVLNQLSITDDTDIIVKEPRIVTLPVAKSTTFYKYAFAASVALLLLSWAALYSVYTNLQNSKGELIALQAANQQFSNRVNYINKELSDTREAMNILHDPNYKRIELKGTKFAPDANMVVAFNPARKEVFIDMSALKLAANDAEHQYQLWALVDGKPVDLGVFDSSDSTGMKKMKAIGVAQAFAVTLEPKGGSVNPTMDQMVVMGGI